MRNFEPMSRGMICPQVFSQCSKIRESLERECIVGWSIDYVWSMLYYFELEHPPLLSMCLLLEFITLIMIFLTAYYHLSSLSLPNSNVSFILLLSCLYCSDIRFIMKWWLFSPANYKFYRSYLLNIKYWWNILQNPIQYLCCVHCIDELPCC